MTFSKERTVQSYKYYLNNEELMREKHNKDQDFE